MTAWWKDFKLSGAEIYVRTTDVRVPINWENTKSVLSWFTYYAAEKAYGLRRVFQKPTANIACLPARPRAWYLLWATAFRAGVNLNAPLEKADALLYFEDQTQDSCARLSHTNMPTVNAACQDVSKSRVQTIFEQIFGYALAVDPQTHTGEMVVKSEVNGAHDGYITRAPMAPKAGWVYQRVIDNREDGNVLDLRCPTIDGKIDLIYLKRRPAAKRFANMNSTCHLAAPEDYLSAQEREQLTRFCAAMGLDWGGLDVLRDSSDGRIYVVDVNKTDMGPPLALPLKDKLRSVGILSSRLKNSLNEKMAASL